MAFNPFASFRKNQKIWMPIILLMTMVTFVLCSGSKGDLSDTIINLFGRREGSPYAKVDGRNVYRKELDDLKEQRNAINEFMKRAAELTIRNINSLESSPNAEKMPVEERRQLFTRLTELKGILEYRALKPRYFDSGIKLEELVDFKVWLHEADRLGINLVPNHVKSLLNMEMFADGVSQDYKIFDAANKDLINSIIREMRSTSQRIPIDTLIFKALNDEFRVRIAQLALALSDPKLEPDASQVSRIPLTPAMLWDSFKENRLAFNVALVPIEVAKFIPQVPEPTETELKDLFQTHYKDRYDPASPKPGFEILPSTRVEMVVGDPASPKFKQWSKAAVLMEATPPVWIPSSPWSVLGRYAGGPLAMRKTLEDQYDYLTGRQSNAREEFLTAKWTEPDVYLATAGYLARKHPEAAASWIAAYAQPGNVATAQLGYYALGAARHPKEMDKGLKQELKLRVPHYAPMILWGTSGSFLDTLGMLGSVSALDYDVKGNPKDKFLPLDVVLDTVTELLERHLAQKWVNANMNALRAKLDEAVGNKAKFERVLDRNLDQMGLERYVTKEKVFYNRFTIDKVQELKPLQQAFDKKYIDVINMIEGRNLDPEKVLHEGDFYKLLFDPTEGFSAFGSTYKAKPWPPLVTPKKGLGEKEPGKPVQAEDLFARAEKPILFWKIEDKVGKIPESIELVKERVLEAWKTDKARDTLALPKAKELADTLQKSEEGFDPVLALQTPINLKGLAPLYTPTVHQNYIPNIPKAFEPGRRDYAPFKIPKDTFSFPRDDFSQKLLSLADLKKPIEIGVKSLDDTNQALFAAGKNTGRIVQILTNKPRTAFYVACVTFKPREPSMEEFHSVLKFAGRTEAFRGGTYKDYFVDMAYEEAGKDHMRALLDQLRGQSNSEILASPDERKSFDQNEGA